MDDPNNIRASTLGELLVRRAPAAALTGVVCVLAIIVLMLPRRPTSALAWLAYVSALSLFVAICLGLAGVLVYLDSRPRHRLVNRVLGFFLAVVPGLAFIYLLFSHADFVMRYFR